jgi:hypothetical protein
MKTLVAALITALLVFTLATAWTEVVHPKQDAESVTPAANTATSASKSRGKRKSRPVVVDEDADDETVDKPIRVVRRAPRAVSAATDETNERLRAQLAEVKQQESRLVATQESLRLIYEDIRSELAAVEEIRRRSANELAAAERRVLEAALNRPSSASLPVEKLDETASNVKAKVPNESPSAQTAIWIQGLVDRGGVAAAVSILSGIKDREAAKVLASLHARDPRLASRLSDELQAAKQSPIRR